MALVRNLIIFILAVQAAIGQQNNSNANILESILNQLHGTLELHLHGPRAAENSFVQSLLRQNRIAVRVQCNQLRTALTGWNLESNAVVNHFYAYQDVQQMQKELKLFENQGGFYVIALEQSSGEDKLLLQFMERVWRQHGHTRIYYIQLALQQAVLYNPFLKTAVRVENPYSYQNIYANLHGYPLRVYIIDSVYSTLLDDGSSGQIFQATGPDVNVAETVARHMNFTLSYELPDDEFFGGRQPNGSYSGGVGRAHRYELDVIFSGFFIKDYLTSRVQFSAAVYMDDLCLYVQKAQRIPQSVVPLYAVREDVWLCFFLVGFVSTFIWLCLRSMNLFLRIEQLSENGHQKIDAEIVVNTRLRCFFIALRILIDTWVVWVRVNVGKFPPYNSERIFLASLCLVSVIFGALLESSLALAYIRPLFYRDINTLAELDHSQMPIYIKHPAFRDDLFYGHDSEVYRRLNAKMFVVAEGDDHLINMIANTGKFAGVSRSASLELRYRRYIMTHKVHKIHQCPKTYHMGYVLPRPSPYVVEINTVLLRILAGGLLNHWISEIEDRAKRNIQHYPEYHAELDMDKWKVLTLTGVQLSFYALSIGCLLATFVYILELLFK